MNEQQALFAVIMKLRLKQHWNVLDMLAHLKGSVSVYRSQPLAFGKKPARARKNENDLSEQTSFLADKVIPVVFSTSLVM